MPVGAAAGGFQLAGMIMNAIGQKRAGDAANELGEFNAGVAEAQAVDAVIIGAQQEENFRAGVRGLVGTQRAGFAGQNVDVGQGTPLDVSADTAFVGELDALQIRTNAARDAWGFAMQAENFRMGGTNAQTASRFSAASTLLGGANSLISTRFGFGQDG